MPRVRFAPSPTGYLHIGSARTFIFNWLYARRNQGTMILRIDDTDVERNTEASLNSIFEGLKWLGLTWDEFYRQSDRLDLHQKLAWQIFANGHAYRDFTPAHQGEEDRAGGTVGPWLFNSAARELSAEESQRRADAGEPFVLRFLVPRHEARYIKFPDAVYATQSKSVNDIEDFALLRSNGIPTYHLASCADDIDLKISHVIRGQDHLSNTFKHILIFEGLGAKPPVFAHLPLLIAPIPAHAQRCAVLGQRLDTLPAANNAAVRGHGFQCPCGSSGRSRSGVVEEQRDRVAASHRDQRRIQRGIEFVVIRMFDITRRRYAGDSQRKRKSQH